MQNALQLIWSAGYIGLLFFGWWAPAAVFYIVGIVFLIMVRRRPRLLITWGVLFLCGFAYTAYDGLYLRWRFDQRAAQYKDLVTLGPVPGDIRTILIERDRPTNTLTGNGQECSFVCAKLLFGGRFDRVIIAVKDPAIFRYGVEPPSRPVAPQSYRTYTRIDRPGCQSVADTSFYAELKAWELFGTCLTETKSATPPDGPRIEVLLDEDTPNAPPWPIQAEHVRAVDAAGIHDIARAEYASVDFAFWLPVPGLFPHGASSGFPTDWRPGFLRFKRTYGPTIGRREAIARILGVSFEGRIPVPDFDKLSADDRLRFTRQILLKGPVRERYDFVKTRLAAMRPLSADYRDAVLEFIRVTNFRGEGYFQMVWYIAWLAADDPGLGPEVAKIYVERALEPVPPKARAGNFVVNLRFFRRDLLEPYAGRLLAAYETITDDDTGSLNLGIGGAGPAVVPKLIAELDATSRDNKRAPFAAASLCRAGDPRAIEPLLAKLSAVERKENTPYPMAYAYALARLGRGADAQRLIALIRGAQSSERKCLDEIVAKYPDGGAPDSICLTQGPYQQVAGAEWQFSESSMHCLAPRTPAQTE